MVIRLLQGITDFVCKALGIKGQYYSGLAMLLHVWRDVAADILSCWQYDFGNEDALASSAQRIPPRPISGRWGRKSACEAFVLGADFEQLRHCFCKVVRTKNYYKEMAKASSSTLIQRKSVWVSHHLRYTLTTHLASPLVCHQIVLKISST